MSTSLSLLQDILMREHALPRERVVPEAELAALGVDSLGLMELVFQVEERFGIRIREDPPTDLRTVGDVARYVDGLIDARPVAGVSPPAERGGSRPAP